MLMPVERAEPLAAQYSRVSERRRILVCVPRYLPGYKSGGPIRSVANMIAKLKSHFDFYVVTRDRDATDTEPYPEIQVDGWNGVGGASVFYCSSVNRAVLQHVMAEVQPELILLNSFHEKFTRLMLLLRKNNGFEKIPVIVAPRGEFSPGALAIKRWKKACYRLLTKSIGLYDSVHWLATSAREREELLRAQPARIISPNWIYVAHNFSDAAPSMRPHPPKSSRTVNFIFISRVSKMKNLHFLLDALRDVNGKIQLTIFGPVADSDITYWNRCKELLLRLPANVTVEYKGPLDHAGVADQLLKHHFFVLPTRGENFCHAAVESFVSGTPVLISNETPWTGLAQAQAGFDLPLANRGQWVRALQDCCDMDQHTYNSFLAGTIRYRERFSAECAAQEHLIMFDSALGLQPARGPCAK
jgi:glycosyltransferase involved in cell wall biosynthesis